MDSRSSASMHVTIKPRSLRLSVNTPRTLSAVLSAGAGKSTLDGEKNACLNISHVSCSTRGLCANTSMPASSKTLMSGHATDLYKGSHCEILHRISMNFWYSNSSPGMIEGVSTIDFMRLEIMSTYPICTKRQCTFKRVMSRMRTLKKCTAFLKNLSRA